MKKKMSKYNVLWLEDEPEKSPTFIEECEEDFGMKLHVYTTRKEGIAALEHMLEFWDAILLDAKMPEESNNEVAGLGGLRQVIDTVNQMSSKKKIPYFISTGQPDLMSDKMFEAMMGNFYKKTIDDAKLMEDMINAIKSSPRQQLKSYYADFFNAAERLSLGNDAEDIVLSILMPIHNPSEYPNFEPKLHYNRLRQLIEHLFRALGRFHVLPEICFALGRVNLNQCSLYLSGKDCNNLGIRYSSDKNNRIIPDFIEDIIHSVLDFGNVNSHTAELSEEDLAIIEELLSKSASRFLIFGFVMQMMEVISWFDSFITDVRSERIKLLDCYTIPTSEASKKYVDKVFTPEFDERTGLWHCEECLILFNESRPVNVRIKDVAPNGSKKSSQFYPYFAHYEIVK